MKADERTRTVNLLITNQLLCQLSHIGALNLIACRSKTSFSRSRCNRLCNENINLTSMQAFVRLMFPSCTQSLFRENWATSAYEFLSDSKGIWTPVTAVKGRCLNRLTMEPCFLFLSLFVFFLFPVFRTCFLMQKSSPSRARTYNPSVNSRVLYHWAIEDYSFSLRWNCYSFWSYTQNHTLKSFIRRDNSSFLPSWISPRPISISQLHVLPHFHLWPINLVVFKGS